MYFLPNRSLPRLASPAGVCALAVPIASAAVRKSSLREVFMVYGSLSSSAGLRDDVDHGRFAFFDDLDPALESCGKIFRIRDRAFAVDPVGFRHFRVVDVGISNGGANMATVHTSVVQSGHTLNEHDLGAIGPVVVHDD